MPPKRARLTTTTVFSKLQQFLARSLALSYSLNRRNIEHDWYAYWNHVLMDMVKDTRNLVVSPQYVVWVTQEDLPWLHGGVQEFEPERDSITSGEAGEASHTHTLVTDRRETRSMALKKQLTINLTKYRTENKATGGSPTVSDNEEPDNVSPSSNASNTVLSNSSNVSAAGSVGTISLPRASSTRIVDFAILKVLEGANPVPDPVDADEVEARNVEVKVIVEVKRFASRKLKGEELRSKTEVTLRNAIDDATYQAALLFERYETLSSVIAVVACGHYWTHAVLRPNNINSEKVGMDLEYNDNYVAAIWPPGIALDEAASWRKLRGVFEKIRE